MQAYLTDKDFEIAKANGINYNVAYNRFYNSGWSAEKAITEPVRKKSNCLWHSYRDQGEKNGVSYHLFYERTKNQGMTPEEAVNTPVVPSGGNHRPLRFTPEVLERAAANGVSKNTLKSRLYSCGWSLEQAISTPIDKSRRRKDYEATRS